MKYIQSIRKDALSCRMIAGEYPWESLNQEKKQDMKGKNILSKAVHAGIALKKRGKSHYLKMPVQTIFLLKSSWRNN